jgi:hypothetical protein
MSALPPISKNRVMKPGTVSLDHRDLATGDKVPTGRAAVSIRFPSAAPPCARARPTGSAVHGRVG